LLFILLLYYIMSGVLGSIFNMSRSVVPSNSDSLDEPLNLPEKMKPFSNREYMQLLNKATTTIFENTELLKDINTRIGNEQNLELKQQLENDKVKILNEIKTAKETKEELEKIQFKPYNELARAGSKRKTKRTKRTNRKRKTNKKSKRSSRNKSTRK
jgi:hypothetical protein